MNARPISRITVLVVASVLFSSGNAIAQCGETSPNCVDVEMVGGGSPPTVNPPTNRFNKGTSSNPGKFSFGLAGSVQGKVYVIFKCQDYESDPFDCRTPAKHSNGQETWVIQLNPGGATPAIQLGSLEKCVDECAGKTNPSHYEVCVQQYCRYPYMVVDVNGNSFVPNPPMDPDIIIDPK